MKSKSNDSIVDRMPNISCFSISDAQTGKCSYPSQLPAFSVSLDCNGVYSQWSEWARHFSKIFLLLLLLGIQIFPGTAAIADTAAEKKRATIDSIFYSIPDFKSADALKAAYICQKIDSSYYVGYLIEAYHLDVRASDEAGLRKVIPYYLKAREIFEQHAASVLEVSNYGALSEDDQARTIQRQRDYRNIQASLIQHYGNLEMPDSAYAVIMQLRKKNLSFDTLPFGRLGWLYYRQRIFTPEKYSFLKNTVNENLNYALSFRDSVYRKYERNNPQLKQQFEPYIYDWMNENLIEFDLLTVNNVTAIVHSYNMQTDSAMHYWHSLDKNDPVVTGNIGFWKCSLGELDSAEFYFEQALEAEDEDEISLSSENLSLSVCHISAANIDEALEVIDDEIAKKGYSFGYGWHNLGLARAYGYAGLLQKSADHLEKAINFDEIHYNTSSREDQYRFLSYLLLLLLVERQQSLNKFEDTRYWTKVSYWQDMVSMMLTKYTALFYLVNALANNPERDIVFYHLSAIESSITFDELWPIIENFSAKFFLNRFTRLLESDPRLRIRKYYRYFIGKLLMKSGKNEEAYQMLYNAFSDDYWDEEREKLLSARLHEACAMAARELDWERELHYHLKQLYEIYPQLVPFSPLKMAFHLEFEDSQNIEPLETLRGKLDAFKIDWLDLDDEDFPTVKLSVATSDTSQVLAYQVLLPKKEDGFITGSLALDTKDLAKKLVYRLFSIQP
ncbi:hypothetical protein JXJ21_03370 [candidate division KSB1 bacterium]|nr:hypothetical protein [candidate division KSB1 bacterium]